MRSSQWYEFYPFCLLVLYAPRSASAALDFFCSILFTNGHSGCVDDDDDGGEDADGDDDTNNTDTTVDIGTTKQFFDVASDNPSKEDAVQAQMAALRRQVEELQKQVEQQQRTKLLKERVAKTRNVISSSSLRNRSANGSETVPAGKGADDGAQEVSTKNQKEKRSKEMPTITGAVQVPQKPRDSKDLRGKTSNGLDEFKEEFTGIRIKNRLVGSRQLQVNFTHCRA